MAQPALFEKVDPRRFGRVEVREISAKSIATAANGRIGSYDFSINPYVGCGFGCSYCYAAFFVPDEERAANWGTWVDVKANAAELLRTTPNLAGAKIYIGSVTDPYQPLERETGLTRSLLEVLVSIKPQPRIVIQTRSDLPVRDIDLLSRFGHLRVNVSITTDDDGIRKRFEPMCLSIERRMEGLRQLKEAGIRTAACLCPLLPVSDPIAFAIRLRALECDRFGVGRFHETRGRFAAGTRPMALRLAEEYGWDEIAYDRTVETMRALLEFGGAFQPE